MSNYIFLDLRQGRFGASSMGKAVLHGERCSLESPSWSSSVRLLLLLLFQLKKRIIYFVSFIALGYSIIAPIINGFACATFFMFYQLYKYLFLYVYQQPTTTDTGGLFYPKAFQHVFTGLYVQQICLCALFFLATDSSGRHSSVAEGALMVVLILITVSLKIFFFQHCYWK